MDSGKEVNLDGSYNEEGNPNSTTLHGKSKCGWFYKFCEE